MRPAGDLNKLLIDDEASGESLRDHRATSADGQTLVLFKNLESELIEHIRAADVVLGCVAWLTSESILLELSRKDGVAIVVQKEDFLRPDLDAKSDWPRRLRRLYDALPKTLDRYDNAFSDTILHMMSYAGDPTIPPVICVGNFNADNRPAFPRAHHKFVVFCRSLSSDDGDGTLCDAPPSFEPYEVWTGSFNFTRNASHSFENAIISQDKNLVSAFFREFAQVTALSEPLDWETDWCAPQWRIGS